MTKSLFKGVFNLSHEVHILYAYARSKEQAKVIFCRRIATQHDIHPSTVMNIFNGEKANFEITIEMEVKEIEE